MATGINPLGGERAQWVQKKNLVKPSYLRAPAPGSLTDRAKHDKVMPANRLLAGANRMHRRCALAGCAAIPARAGGDRGG
jgi:hypothetical protein